jgi:hypothetical protein
MSIVRSLMYLFSEESSFPMMERETSNRIHSMLTSSCSRFRLISS